VEVYVGMEIIQILHRIFKACIKWDLWDFELLKKTNVGHIPGE
jgi:hypothetical protein